MGDMRVFVTKHALNRFRQRFYSQATLSGVICTVQHALTKRTIQERGRYFGLLHHGIITFVVRREAKDTIRVITVYTNQVCDPALPGTRSQK